MGRHLLSVACYCLPRPPAMAFTFILTFPYLISTNGGHSPAFGQCPLEISARLVIPACISDSSSSPRLMPNVSFSVTLFHSLPYSSRTFFRVAPLLLSSFPVAVVSLILELEVVFSDHGLHLIPIYPSYPYPPPPLGCYGQLLNLLITVTILAET